MKLKSIFYLSSLRIGLILTLLMLFLSYQRPMFMEQLESRAFDIRFKLRYQLDAQLQGAKEVVVITMDEKAIENLGRWPWPRTDWAKFLITLGKYNPKVISLDVVFSEPDQNINVNYLKDVKSKYEELAKEDQAERAKCRELAEEPKPDPFIPYLEQVQAQANTDQVLAQALEQVKNVAIGWFYFQTDEEAKQVTWEENLKRLDLIKRFAVGVVKYQGGASTLDMVGVVEPILGFQINLPQFTEKLAGSGYFSVVSDEDGIYRRAYLLSGWPPYKKDAPPEYYKDFMLFPAMDLETLRVYLGESPVVTIEPYPLVVREIKMGRRRIPVSEDGSMLINYVGDLGKFEHYSFYDVYSDFAEMRKTGFEPEKALKDKIILIGATATAIYDQRTTPLGTFPGIALHANIIDNILYERALYRPTWMWGFDLIAITFLGMFLSFIYPRIKPVFTTGVTILLAAAYLALNYYVFDQMHVSLTITYPVTAILVVYMGITLYHYTMEEREKRFIRSAFSFYLAPAVIDDLMNDPSKLKLGGENKRVTIFFSDIVGFTSISETLPTEQLVRLLNEYLTEMSDIVLKNRGTVDKYIGDAVMAIFGAPVDYPDHAATACLTSLEMHQRLDELNKKWSAQDYPALRCRIGLNTGEVKVGNMGSLKRMDYTVIGDEVNLASRLEGANKAYGTHFMVSEATYQDAKDVIEARELDLITVAGRLKPVRVYQVLTRKGQLSPQKAELVLTFTRALESYRQTKFMEALGLFQKCLEIEPQDPPAKVYLQRCQAYIETPPPLDWDGVWRLTKK